MARYSFAPLRFLGLTPLVFLGCFGVGFSEESLIGVVVASVFVLKCLGEFVCVFVSVGWFYAFN